MSITASDARSRLFPPVEQVNADQEAVEITSKKGVASLVPENGYRAWRETMYVLSSPANAARLAASTAEARAGDVQEHALVDPAAG